MQPKNSIKNPKPLFSTSTAYKYLLGLQPDQKENAVYALFHYIYGDVVQVWRGHNIGLGIEKYQFQDDIEYDAGYELLTKLKTYEDCVGENIKVAQMLKPTLDAFYTAYNPETTTWINRLRANIKIGKPYTFIKNAYDAYQPLVIKKDTKDLVVIDGCAPIFGSVAHMCSCSSNIYVYELRLIKSVSDMDDLYFIRPCVQISLFKNIDDANTYFQSSIAESREFQKHKFYPQLADIARPAMQRFNKYMGR